MKSHILILEGHDCKAVSQERLTAFLKHLGEKLALTPTPMGGPHWNAPNPGALYREKAGFLAWSYWSDGLATVAHEEASKKVTLCLQMKSHTGFMDADVLFRWYFEPQQLLNCLPVLSSPRG